MGRSPDSLVPSAGGQLRAGKRNDKAPGGRRGSEANARAATTVNAVAASSTPPTSRPTQLEIFPGPAFPLKAKPATGRRRATRGAARRDGVKGGGTRRKTDHATGETLFGPAEALTPHVGREAHKGSPRKRGNEAGQGVGGGHSTAEPRENRGEGRAAAFAKRTKRRKTAGLPPRGTAISRPKPRQRLDPVRKLQRALYRVAKLEPGRRFTWLYDKVCRPDVLAEAWRRVKANGGAAGIDRVTVADIGRFGEERFLSELQEALQTGTFRVQAVRRVHIPKPGQPGKTRPLGIPAVSDRVVQMAVKLVIEPLFEADFLPCSYGFRPKRGARMALAEIVQAMRGGCGHVIDVDLRSYFDSIDRQRLLALVGRRVGDVRVLRLLRAWLHAGVMEDGKVTQAYKGTPQGGVISPLLSNIMLHEVDRQWSGATARAGRVRLIRYADDMVALAPTAHEAAGAWSRLQAQFAELLLEVNQEKSRVTTAEAGFAFLGFEFRRTRGRTYLWPRAKACRHIGERVRATVCAMPSSASLEELIRKLNPVLNGWCTYFRVGNSNRVFHRVDWMVRRQTQLWLRRKHRCAWRHAQRRWHYRYLHDRCRLYRMVGKVSYLDGVR